MSNSLHRAEYLDILYFDEADEAIDQLCDWSNYELAEYALWATRILKRVEIEKDDLWFEEE